jgi:uncharacterized protein
MTPAERQLVTELFDRLATLEDAQRDPDAERAIRDGLAQAPNAVYALVQTALVQDEALKNANTRIQQLEAELDAGNAPQRQGGFLDSMRGSIWGRQEPRGSVPNVRPGDAPMGAPPGFGGPQMGGPQTGGPGYGPQGQMQPEPPPQGRGGSFLGTAAAAAAGAIGGSLLLDSIRGMTGGGRSGHALADQAHASGGGGGGLPWGSGGGGGGELARQAGLDDIGRSSGSGPFGQSQGQGAFGNASGGKSGDSDTYEDANAEDDDDLDDGDDFDDGDDGGGSDSDE